MALRHTAFDPQRKGLRSQYLAPDEAERQYPGRDLTTCFCAARWGR
jgi:hypothetical protein